MTGFGQYAPAKGDSPLKYVLLATALFSASALPQTHSDLPIQRKDIGLPLVDNEGALSLVTNGQSTSDCTGGGGPILAPLRSQGSTYMPRRGGLEAVSVREFGAKGDGVNDDTAAIQAALNAGQHVLCPAGNYRITSPLDLTNLSTALTFEGTGKSGACTILGDTGSVVFDATGSSHLTFRNFAVDSGLSNSSTIAFLFARSSTNGYAQFDRIENVHVRLNSIPSANGGHGTAALYDYAAEIFTMIDPYFQADIPAVFTSENVWSINSTYATIQSGPQSMSQVSALGAPFFSARSGPAVYFYGANGMEFFNTDFFQEGGNTFPYAVVMDGPADAGITGYDFIGGGPEFFSQFIDLRSNVLSGLTVRCSYSPRVGHPAILLDGTGSNLPYIENGYIAMSPGNSAAHPLIAGKGNYGGLINSIVHLSHGQSIAISSALQASGNIFQDDTTVPSISTPAVSSNIVLSRRGVSFTGAHSMNVGSAVKPKSVIFPNLGAAPEAGTFLYCSDCRATPICSPRGAGHLAVSDGSNWTCR